MMTGYAHGMVALHRRSGDVVRRLQDVGCDDKTKTRQDLLKNSTKKQTQKLDDEGLLGGERW
jgi:hypothetical protein